LKCASWGTGSVMQASHNDGVTEAQGGNKEMKPSPGQWEWKVENPPS
jgi:hypothetical protein